VVVVCKEVVGCKGVVVGGTFTVFVSSTDTDTDTDDGDTFGGVVSTDSFSTTGGGIVASSIGAFSTTRRGGIVAFIDAFSAPRCGGGGGGFVASIEGVGGFVASIDGVGVFVASIDGVGGFVASIDGVGVFVASIDTFSATGASIDALSTAGGNGSIVASGIDFSSAGCVFIGSDLMAATGTRVWSCNGGARAVVGTSFKADWDALLYINQISFQLYST
jgi:hypothetical protein